MSARVLHIIKSGIVIEEYDLNEVKFGIVFGTVTLQDRSTNEILTIFSPMYYDKVEVCSDAEED